MLLVHLTSFSPSFGFSPKKGVAGANEHSSTLRIVWHGELSIVNMAVTLAVNPPRSSGNGACAMQTADAHPFGEAGFCSFNRAAFSHYKGVL